MALEPRKNASRRNVVVVLFHVGLSDGSVTSIIATFFQYLGEREIQVKYLTAFPCAFEKTVWATSLDVVGNGVESQGKKAVHDNQRTRQWQDRANL